MYLVVDTQNLCVTWVRQEMIAELSDLLPLTLALSLSHDPIPSH